MRRNESNLTTGFSPAAALINAFYENDANACLESFSQVAILEQQDDVDSLWRAIDFAAKKNVGGETKNNIEMMTYCKLACMQLLVDNKKFSAHVHIAYLLEHIIKKNNSQDEDYAYLAKAIGERMLGEKNDQTVMEILQKEISKGNPQIIWLLESFYPHIQVPGKYFRQGRAFFKAACQCNHHDVVRFLMSKERAGAFIANPNTRFEKTHLNAGVSQCLKLACIYGSNELIATVLECVDKKLVNSTYGKGVTALIIACTQRDLSTVKLLVEQGEAKVKKTVTIKHGEETYFSPLLSAVERGHKEIYDYLVEKGATLPDYVWVDLLFECIKKNLHDRLEFFISIAHIRLDVVNTKGKTPLVFALEKENNVAAKKLIQAGILNSLPSKKREQLKNELYVLACMHDDTELFHLLNAQMEEDSQNKDQNQRWLTCAAKHGATKIAQCLIDDNVLPVDEKTIETLYAKAIAKEDFTLLTTLRLKKFTVNYRKNMPPLYLQATQAACRNPQLTIDLLFAGYPISQPIEWLALLNYADIYREMRNSVRGQKLEDHLLTQLARSPLVQNELLKLEAFQQELQHALKDGRWSYAMMLIKMQNVVPPINHTQMVCLFSVAFHQQDKGAIKLLLTIKQGWSTYQFQLKMYSEEAQQMGGQALALAQEIEADMKKMEAGADKEVAQEMGELAIHDKEEKNEKKEAVEKEKEKGCEEEKDNSNKSVRSFEKNNTTSVKLFDSPQSTVNNPRGRDVTTPILQPTPNLPKNT